VLGALDDGRDVLVVDVPEGGALEAWRALKELHPETGLWPFLIGPAGRTNAERVWEEFAEGRRRNADYDGSVDAEWRLARWYGSRAGTPSADLPRSSTSGTDEYHCGPLDLPAEPGAGTVSAATATEIVLCPADPGGIDILRSVAWTGTGNHDMTGAQHAEVLEYWREEFGVELLSLSSSMIELAVPNPPTDPAVVARVAEEQAEYCPDIVDQGAGTVEVLALEQVHSHHWYFWWD